MSKTNAFFALFFSAALVAALAPAAWGGTSTLPDMEGVEFVACYDGDTCTFLIEGRGVAVRLRGIDTPEIRGKCPGEIRKARAAKQFLEWHLKRAASINLVEVELGLYKRLVATVMVNGKDISARILKVAKKRGFARPYNGKTKRKAWCPARVTVREAG